MSASTAKRAVLYRFDRQPLEVIVSAVAHLREQAPGDQLECITPDGSLRPIAFSDLKALCFFSETGPADLFTGHNLFERRPKVPGLWTRFTFRDGDLLDGILSHNLLDWPVAGYLVTPPRSGANRQRVFIPRAALIGTELRGVVGRASLSSRRSVRGQTAGEQTTQLKMFDL